MHSKTEASDTVHKCILVTYTATLKAYSFLTLHDEFIHKLEISWLKEKILIKIATYKEK